MGGGMEDCAKLFERQIPAAKPDYERAIDHMYESWLSFAGKSENKKHHPSRAEYGQIIKHAQLWNKAVNELNKQAPLIINSNPLDKVPEFKGSVSLPGGGDDR